MQETKSWCISLLNVDIAANRCDIYFQHNFRKTIINEDYINIEKYASL